MDLFKITFTVNHIDEWPSKSFPSRLCSFSCKKCDEKLKAICNKGYFQTVAVNIKPAKIVLEGESMIDINIEGNLFSVDITYNKEEEADLSAGLDVQGEFIEVHNIYSSSGQKIPTILYEKFTESYQAEMLEEYHS